MKPDLVDLHIGAKVRQFRLDRLLSLQALALRLNRTASWVRALEEGQIRFCSGDLVALAAIFRMAPSMFFGPLVRVAG